MGGMKGKPALPSPNAMKWVIAGVASPDGARYGYHAKKILTRVRPYQMKR